MEQRILTKGFSARLSGQTEITRFYTGQTVCGESLEIAKSINAVQLEKESEPDIEQLEFALDTFFDIEFTPAPELEKKLNR